MRVLYHVLLPCLFLRIQKATESLRTFHPSADPCFDEFVLDTSREETLLKEMCFGGGTTDLFFNLNVVRWEWKHKASRKTTVTFLKTKQKSYLCLNPAVVACFQAVLWPPVFKGVSVVHCSDSTRHISQTRLCVKGQAATRAWPKAAGKSDRYFMSTRYDDMSLTLKKVFVHVFSRPWEKQALDHRALPF